jgi:DNA repair protein RadC
MKKHNLTKKLAVQLSVAFTPAPYHIVINTDRVAFNFIVEVCTPMVDDEDVHYTALLLDDDYALIGYLHHCLGTKGDDNLDLGVLAAAICLSHARRVVVACYQPKDDTMPQDGDYMLSIMLQALCGQLDVTLYDYIIFDGSQYYSFQAHGAILC